MTHTALLPPCSVLLLSGGRGNRMGGRDKGLIEWQGRPLIAWLHDQVRPLTDDLIISCNRNSEHYAAFADQLVRDDDDEFQGPLAGIRAGLLTMHHPYLLVVPCEPLSIQGGQSWCAGESNGSHCSAVSRLNVCQQLKQLG